MTKSELIEILAQRQGHLKADDVDLAVKSLLEMMGSALANGERIEVRGFGSFSLHYRPPRTGRIPRPARPLPCRASTFRISSRARSFASGSATSCRCRPTTDIGPRAG